MSKVIEIVTFPCSEAFSNDQATVFAPALEASMESPGCLQYAITRFIYAGASQW
jgi:quinol monooxygenase YgiN